MALVRCASNPVLSASDIPFDASLIFNAGVCKFNGRYVMVFRNDVGFAAAVTTAQGVHESRDRLQQGRREVGRAAGP